MSRPEDGRIGRCGGNGLAREGCAGIDVFDCGVQETVFRVELRYLQGLLIC